MSFDLHLQGFRSGEPSGTGRAEMLATLSPCRPAEDGYLGLTTSDGGADLYVHEDGLTASHLVGDEVWEMLVRGARSADWVIMPVGCPTALTRPGQRHELPPELVEAELVLVTTGSELLSMINGNPG